MLTAKRCNISPQSLVKESTLCYYAHYDITRYHMTSHEMITWYYPYPQAHHLNSNQSHPLSPSYTWGLVSLSGGRGWGSQPHTLTTLTILPTSVKMFFCFLTFTGATNKKQDKYLQAQLHVQHILLSILAIVTIKLNLTWLGYYGYCTLPQPSPKLMQWPLETYKQLLSSINIEDNYYLVWPKCKWWLLCNW